jgi:hypothetical protein
MSTWLRQVGGLLAPLPEGGASTVNAGQVGQRLAGAATPDDRKRQVKLLRSAALSRSNHEVAPPRPGYDNSQSCALQEIGKLIPQLLDILRTDRENLEAVCDVLEILTFIMKVPAEVPVVWVYAPHVTAYYRSPRRRALDTCNFTTPRFLCKYVSFYSTSLLKYHPLPATRKHRDLVEAA